ncbi:hypothetical protein BJ170DRAFT_374534 [Xylariales sp. AK1849]|nr:hypothetical protein BJ170DRAFT_374534 [Xylariales sp. AK1849]
MVGVKGKYKGCNTCRRRRVPCDNTRPFCKRCTDRDRVCEGYEQETIFIVGTVDDKGRCASHPPRSLQSPRNQKGQGSGVKKGPKKAKISDVPPGAPDVGRSSGSQSADGDWLDAGTESVGLTMRREYEPVQPLQSAWTETLALASVGGLLMLRAVGIHADLTSVLRQDHDDGEVRLTLPSSHRVDVTPPISSEEDFRLSAHCYLHIPRQGHDSQDDEGLCLFLYEQNSSAAYSNKPPWKDPAALSDPVRQLGPAYFKTFPAHHFFARVYRPSAILTSLLAHQPTPLSSPEWQTVPYERHPKTPLDIVLDLLSQIPSLLSRADRILSLPASIGRRLKAKDLLSNCAAIEGAFERWYAQVEEDVARANREWPLMYWAANRGGGGAASQEMIPFADTFEFPNGMLGLAHIYYWTGLIALHAAMRQLVDAVVLDQGVSGASSPMPASGPASPFHHHGLRHGYGHPSPGSSSANSYAGAIPVASSSISSSISTTSLTTSYFQPGTINNDLPPSIDPGKYQTREIRKLAANVCRSLDWAIGSSEADGGRRGEIGPLGQPDLIAAPLYVVEKFYEGIRVSGDGELEGLWCVGFRGRLERRGREIDEVVLGTGGDEMGPGIGMASSQGRSRGKGKGKGKGKVSEEQGARGRGWIEIGRFGDER